MHWNTYYKGLKEWANENNIGLPEIPDWATNNVHMFYLRCKDLEQRNKLISKLKSNGMLAVFHYLSLQKSPYYIDKDGGRNLINADNYIVRPPFYYELEKDTINFINNKLYEALQ